MTAEASGTGPSVEVRDVSFSYGAPGALDGVSLTANGGRVLGLMGDNGAGKSTLLQVIAGLRLPQRGQVLFPGNRGRDLRAYVGYCPQESLVFCDLTAKEQLVLAVRAHGASRDKANARAQELTLRLGLWGHEHKLAAALSGGMLRRLNIALSLASAPGLWLLDEPSAGLDAEQRALLHVCIRHERDQGTCVILCSHDDAEVRALSDTVCVMHKGRSVALGAPGELLARLQFPASVEITFARVPDQKQEISERMEDALGNVPMVWSGAALQLDVGETVDSVALVASVLGDLDQHPLSISARQKSLTDAARALCKEAAAA